MTTEMTAKMTSKMTNMARGITIGAMAAGIAIMCLPPVLAAQERNTDSSLLLAANQVVLEHAADTKDGTEPVGSGKRLVPPPQRNLVPVWVPRIRDGAPANRVGGATRGSGEPVEIATLVPKNYEQALTLAAQPNLHWHLSAATNHAVIFALTVPGVPEPIVEELISGPFEAGFHTFSLADYDARLEPGRHYDWAVGVVPEGRSADPVAHGAISRIADSALTARVELAEPEAVASLWAGGGIWYEALDALSRGIEQNPEDPQLRMYRSAMLEQVGLKQVGDVISEDR